jgi:signal transduction histidine kinase
VLAEDVGEHKRLEGQLRQAQRMEAVGRLASGVAHDFNNLVMAVIGNSDLLLAQTPPDDPRRGEAEEIRNAGARAATLTKQLLAFGRGQALEPVVLDLNETVTALEPMLRRLIRSNVAIEMRLDQRSAVSAPTAVRSSRSSSTSASTPATRCPTEARSQSPPRTPSSTRTTSAITRPAMASRGATPCST